MTIIEGIGDEVIHFVIALFVVVIGIAAWWTTNISEQRYVRTVVLLERRRNHRRLTNHTEAVTIAEGSTAAQETTDQQVTTENSTTETLSTPDQVASVSKPPETTSVEENLISGASESNLLQENLGEEENIIETMDADANIVRQRRLAFYGGFNNEQGATSSQSAPSSSAHFSDPIPSAPVEDTSPNAPKEETEGDSSAIIIKLKYINDDLKLVDGKLNESLGDFKKRHFLPEISANKLVRLIFNGQVLQPDTQTLKKCGLFDHCVVHCLIHQKRNQSPDPNVTESRREGYSFPNPRGSANNNNQNRDWDLGNFLFAFISFILLAAWYFRYVYAHLYTVTATVGLILITGIFTIVLVGMYFPDNEQYQNPTFRIRERTQQQQE